MEKETLHGIVTLSLAVREADGILDQGAKVTMSGDLEVREAFSAQDLILGYVLCANTVAGGNATIVTPFKRVTTEESGEAFAYGTLVNLQADGQLMAATPGHASGTITISDYSAVDSGDTVTVNGVTLTAGGTDWTAATSNAATALSLATAINNRVPGVKASASSGGIVTVESLVAGASGNAITLATSMTVTVEGTVSGATLTGGRDFRPMGMALQAATGADEDIQVGWFV